MSTSTDIFKLFKEEKIKVTSTKKIFYNCYPYKASYRLRGSRYISVSEDFDKVVVSLYRYLKSYEREKYNNDILDKLRHFHSLYHSDLRYRFRSEGSSISIFALDVDHLQTLVFDLLKDYKSSIDLISIVDDKDYNDIMSGKEIMSKDTGFKYKVTLRNGWLGNNTVISSLASYLTALKESGDIRITKNLLYRLQKSNKYVQSGYFYVNDLRLIDMIHLIGPTLVRSVTEIKVNQ